MKRLFVLFILVLFSINLSNADSLKLTKEESKIFNEIKKVEKNSKLSRKCLQKIRYKKVISVTEDTSAIELITKEKEDPCLLAALASTNNSYKNFYLNVSCKLGNTQSCDYLLLLNNDSTLTNESTLNKEELIEATAIDFEEDIIDLVNEISEEVVNKNIENYKKACNELPNIRKKVLEKEDIKVSLILQSLGSYFCYMVKDYEEACRNGSVLACHKLGISLEKPEPVQITNTEPKEETVTNTKSDLLAFFAIVLSVIVLLILSIRAFIKK